MAEKLSFFLFEKTRFWLEPQITAVIINWQSIVVAIVDCIESFIETKRKREQSENCSFFCLKKRILALILEKSTIISKCSLLFYERLTCNFLSKFICKKDIPCTECLFFARTTGKAARNKLLAEI